MITKSEKSDMIILSGKKKHVSIIRPLKSVRMTYDQHNLTNMLDFNTSHLHYRLKGKIQ